MSFTEQSSRNKDELAGIDPFIVVAGLIVAILLGSLALWVNGGDKIQEMRQSSASAAPPAISADA